jgi:DNA-binding transcriptional ArsR family regulator
MLDATFFALSERTRRGILERLGRGPATLSQLARACRLGRARFVGRVW